MRGLAHEIPNKALVVVLVLSVLVSECVRVCVTVVEGWLSSSNLIGGCVGGDW